MSEEMKPVVYIPYDRLTAGKDWEIGQTYRIKLIVKQKTKDEDGAMFEIIDASSLEMPGRKERAEIHSDSGTYKGA
ncbi:hypothetical protein M0R04_10930 [Candidatus Dojkabacteria bacterium]|jgi:hypothetical protein|nr:hypothetical protein [Candidatus Dojkabacteria bacterium]